MHEGGGVIRRHVRDVRRRVRSVDVSTEGAALAAAVARFASVAHRVKREDAVSA